MKVLLVPGGSACTISITLADRKLDKINGNFGNSIKHSKRLNIHDDLIITLTGKYTLLHDTRRNVLLKSFDHDQSVCDDQAA